MFCHNKPLFRARSKGLGRLAHSVYSFFASEQNDLYPLVKFALYLKNLWDRAFAFTFTSNAIGESLFQLIHGLIDSVIHQ